MSKEELEELRQAAIEMRFAQVEYFATREPDVLVRAKKAEKQLDELLFGETLKMGAIKNERARSNSRQERSD